MIPKNLPPICILKDNSLYFVDQQLQQSALGWKRRIWSLKELSKNSSTWFIVLQTDIYTIKERTLLFLLFKSYQSQQKCMQNKFKKLR